MRKLHSTTRWIARTLRISCSTRRSPPLTTTQNVAITPVCAHPESRIKTNRRVERGFSAVPKRKEKASHTMHTPVTLRTRVYSDRRIPTHRTVLSQGFPETPRRSPKSRARNCEKETAEPEEDPHRSAKTPKTNEER